MEGNECYRSSAYYFHGMLFECARARCGAIAANYLRERARATAVLKIAYRGGWGGVLILGTFWIGVSRAGPWRNVVVRSAVPQTSPARTITKNTVQPK